MSVENLPAFPCRTKANTSSDPLATPREVIFTGMTLRDWFAGQALANRTICSGSEPEWQLSIWFGKYSSGITRQQIVTRQAFAHADAMLAERSK